SPGFRSSPLKLLPSSAAAAATDRTAVMIRCPFVVPIASSTATARGANAKNSVEDENYSSMLDYAQAPAPYRAPRLRSRGAPREFQEGGGRARSHADGDQPPDPALGAVLRDGAFPPPAATASVGRGRRSALSRRSRRSRGLRCR